MLKPKPQLHCDYLDINVKFSTEESEKFHPFFEVKRQAFTTRHFSVIEDIYYNNTYIAQVRRKPFSEAIPADTVLIKFANWILYRYKPYEYVKRFLELNGLTFQNFARIDFSLDFQQFDNDMQANTFIKRVATGSALKMGKASKASTKFTQKGNRLSYEYLRYGSALSEISYYMYNKTLEMEEVKFKPYIADSWEKAGFDMNKEVWRIEFSLKSNNKMIVHTGTGDTLSLKSLELLHHENLTLTYAVLRRHYWRFVWNDGQAKKGRMREIKLFDDSYSEFILAEGDSIKDATRSTKIFIKKLEETAQEIRGKDMDSVWHTIDLKNRIIDEHGLRNWAVKKGLA